MLGGSSGKAGTGGLLIIYANKLNNNANIQSDGVENNGSNGSTGGSTGGGSINIFYNSDDSYMGTATVTGGAAAKTLNYGNYGGAGGDGTVSYDKIVF